MHNVIKRSHYCIIKHIHFFINVLNLLHDNDEHKQTRRKNKSYKS